MIVVFSNRWLIYVVVFAAAACNPLLAQFPVPSKSQLEDTTPSQVREVVANYCRLDYEGARLDAQQWSKFKPLVWWSSAPQYSQIDVIARYIVDREPAATGDKYTVSVHYRLLGVYDMANGYVPEPAGSMQNLDFGVSSQNSEWRIADADNNFPHPSRAAMLNWLKAQLASAQDDTAKQRYQRALTLIEAQPASPFAK